MINFSDPQIWVAIAFILFFSFCGKFIWIKISGFLDAKINGVRAEIYEAQKIHDDAKILLSTEMKKFQDLEKTIKNILLDGKLQMQEMEQKSKENTDIEIKKIEKVFMEKIKYIESQVINEIKNRIASQAIQVTQNFLSKELDANSQLDNINISVSEIENSLKKNSSFI